MADILSRKKRSALMARIGSKNTKPEMILRKALFAAGFRYRLHDPSLPGKPDIVLKRFQAVIFVNGCFWHGHKGCKDFKLPATNRKFWRKKIEDNRKRDRRNIAELKKAGWHVLVVWECSILGFL